MFLWMMIRRILWVGIFPCLCFISPLILWWFYYHLVPWRPGIPSPDALQKPRRIMMMTLDKQYMCQRWTAIYGCWLLTRVESELPYVPVHLGDIYCLWAGHWHGGELKSYYWLWRVLKGLFECSILEPGGYYQMPFATSCTLILKWDSSWQFNGRHWPRNFRHHR